MQEIKYLYLYYFNWIAAMLLRSKIHFEKTYFGINMWWELAQVHVKCKY